MAGNSVDSALDESRAALLQGIRSHAPSDDDVTSFVEQFRDDFTREIKSNDTWAHDREHVLALSRAIGAFAEFLAIRDSQKAITLEELNHAYLTMKDDCGPLKRSLASPRGKYCTGVSSDVLA